MSLPAEMGAPGRKATFSGSCGMACAAEAEPMAAAKAFSNMGAKESTPAPLPASARSGAFQADESVQRYTGNPRDAQ